MVFNDLLYLQPELYDSIFNHLKVSQKLKVRGYFSLIYCFLRKCHQ